MKKDIHFPKVEGVQVAIARSRNAINQYEWAVYLINENNFALENILITSKGYGMNSEGETQKTSILRHMIYHLAPKSFAIIEAIQPEVFHLCSEYWVSYYIGQEIYDKRFIFLPETIVESNLSKIPMLKLEGILHN